VARVIVVTIAALVSIELLLQILSLVTWIVYRRRSITRSEGPAGILCIGDSYTYGLGASSNSRSYPAQLEMMLTTFADGLGVTNAGWPGRNSRDVLVTLGALLQRTKPALVYVMVGANDLWTKPAALVLPTDATTHGSSGINRFRLTWRTYRLIALLRHRLERGQPEPTPVGSGVTPVTPPAPSAQSAASAGPLNGATTQDYLLSAGWRALDSGDVGGAEQLFALASSGAPDDIDAHMGLLKTYVFSGRPDAVEQELAWIRHAHEQDFSEGTALRLVHALEITGRMDEALRTAEDLADRFPRNAWLWKSVAWHTYQRGDATKAVHAIEVALSLAAPDDPNTRGHFFDVRADIVRKIDAAEAVRSAISAYRLRLDEKRFVQWLQVNSEIITTPLVTESLLHLDVPAEERRRIETLYETAVAPPASATMQVLEGHLRQIVDIARRSGADAVFLSYPFPSPLIEQVASRVAASTGSGWLNIRAMFDARLKTTTREELFVPDGHLNDCGYALVAQAVATDVRRRLSRKRIRREVRVTIPAGALEFPKVS